MILQLVSCVPLYITIDTEAREIMSIRVDDEINVLEDGDLKVLDENALHVTPAERALGLRVAEEIRDRQGWPAWEYGL